MTVLTRNPSNTNYLQSTKFQLIFPNITTVTYFCQEFVLPGLNTTAAIQPTPFSDLHRPGDKLRYDEFEMDFIVDEELWSWQIIHDWIRGYTFPCSFEEYRLMNRMSLSATLKSQPQYSDGQLLTLSALNNPKLKIKFVNLFPVSLSGINFSTENSADTIITAKAKFWYHIFNIER